MILGSPCACIRTTGQFAAAMAALGVDVAALSQADLLKWRRKHMAMVFQSFALFPWKTVLENVLVGIRLAHSIGLWVEVVTLVVPGFNDSSEELMEAARFLCSVSPDIPWHVTAFHPDYKMIDPPPTSTKRSGASTSRSNSSPGAPRR